MEQAGTPSSVCFRLGYDLCALFSLWGLSPACGLGFQMPAPVASGYFLAPWECRACWGMGAVPTVTGASSHDTCGMGRTVVFIDGKTGVREGTACRASQAVRSPGLSIRVLDSGPGLCSSCAWKPQA